MFPCGKCLLNFSSFSRLCNHLSCSHVGEILTCGLGGCQQSFKSANALKSHGYRCHTALVMCTGRNSTTFRARNSCERDSTESIANSSDNDVQVLQSNNCSIAIDNQLSAVENEKPNGVKAQINLKNAVSTLFVFARELYLLPSTTTSDIFKSFCSMLDEFHKDYTQLFLKVLKENNISSETVNSELYQAICSEDFITKCFKNTSTEHLVKKYIEESMPFAAPYKRRVNSHNQEKAFYAHYVSIRSVLELLSLHSDFVAETTSYLREGRDVNNLRDVKDGELFNYPSPDYNAEGYLVVYVPFMLYSDEFEVCNPLGSAKVKHKVSAYYFSFLSLPPKYRRKRHSMHLACLVRDTVQKQVGHAKVLEPLLKEIEEFENIPLICGGIHFYPRLAFICADNLTAHCLGGFQCSFSSGYICRYCTIRYGPHRHCFDPDDFDHRTRESYVKHLGEPEDNVMLRCGVGKQCCFLGKDFYFDPTTMFPLDVMHDMLEGCVPLVVTVSLSKLIESELLSLRLVNERLQAFSYSYCDSTNKYSCKLTIKHLRAKKIPGTASEKWNLLIFLPLILGDLIEGENEHWNLLLRCREIADLLLAECFPRVKLHYLSRLISWFLTALNTVAPDSLTPKCHFLLHYPALI